MRSRNTHNILLRRIYPMKDYIQKASNIGLAIINIVKTIFKIFGIKELEYDVTGENWEAIKGGLDTIADQF